MNEDDLIELSKTNLLTEKKLLTLLKMGSMLKSELPVTTTEMQEEIDTIIEVLSEEIELGTIRIENNKPKPFDIASWIDDSEE